MHIKSGRISVLRCKLTFEGNPLGNNEGTGRGQHIVSIRDEAAN